MSDCLWKHHQSHSETSLRLSNGIFILSCCRPRLPITLLWRITSFMLSRKPSVCGTPSLACRLRSHGAKSFCMIYSKHLWERVSVSDISMTPPYTSTSSVPSRIQEMWHLHGFCSLTRADSHMEAVIAAAWGKPSMEHLFIPSLRIRYVSLVSSGSLGYCLRVVLVLRRLCDISAQQPLKDAS